MPSIDEASASIARDIAQTEQTAAGITGSKNKLAELAGSFAGLGADGRAAESRTIESDLDEAITKAAELRSILERAHTRTEALRGALLRTATPASTAGGTAQPAPPFKPMRTNPAKRDQIAPYVGRKIAFATLWDDKGRQLVGLHCAGTDGPAANTGDVKEPWASYPRMKLHVEAHAAARMRRDGLAEAALYINLPPCRYPDGCKNNIADLLPDGSKLWVHEIKSNGTVRVHKFEGTGRALKHDR